LESFSKKAYIREALFLLWFCLHCDLELLQLLCLPVNYFCCPPVFLLTNFSLTVPSVTHHALFRCYRTLCCCCLTSAIISCFSAFQHYSVNSLMSKCASMQKYILPCLSHIATVITLKSTCTSFRCVCNIHAFILLSSPKS